ncbi:hypothetical protein EVAR_73647_1 [Eumeta japonica]|uniref:Uncharacterized protein n=1 Tax=Eumeta variegata TaxID=151549 RepID=A0A4C1SR15_EUMVA|nr:hypothetical protein EVAR_73647_1 [Eumeta japonica]
MSLCAFPQVRIYEDFDKMSAKEVYYNEAGKKITVKLLHFPEVPPEQINQITFEEEEKQQMEIINGNKPVPAAESDIEKVSTKHFALDNKGEMEYLDEERNYEDEDSEADEGENVEHEIAALAKKDPNHGHKKALRKIFGQFKS